MPSNHYPQFIDEAFVQPIRSVLIIDDDYPTFDEMLLTKIMEDRGELPIRTKAWYSNPARIKKVIDSFRTPKRPLLVDIHDGTNVEVGAEIKVAAHLHQSDLLVLDYELDKTKPGDGSRAIEIIRTLTKNNHFNLVVVHTSDDLDKVFQAVLLGLMSPSFPMLDSAEISVVDELIEAGEASRDGFSRELLETITLPQYIHARGSMATFERTMAKGQQPYSSFHAEAEYANWSPQDRKLVLRYLLTKVEDSVRAKLYEGTGVATQWSDNKTKWIKTDSAFVAFSQKTDDDDLLGDLQAALVAWNPQPSRLFLAKLRAEMDEYGVTAQAGALGNRHALAHWYARLLKSTGEERRWLVAETISRHSEQLLGGILPGVEKFAKKLVIAESRSRNPNAASLAHFSVDLTDNTARLRAEREHNAYVCSKPAEGWHLTTGHVFVMGGHHWVCLSPACDTVPSQLSAANRASFGERLPFIAARLHPVSDTKELAVQSNRYIFLSIAGSVKGFCFNDPSDPASAPTWQTLFAEKRGVFGKNFSLKIISSQLTKDGALQPCTLKANAIAQLRYEYALNLMHRLGASLTRVGLDFAGK